MRKMCFIIIVVLLFSINVAAQFEGGSGISVDPWRITNATPGVEIDEASFVKGSGNTGNEAAGGTIPDPQEKFHDVALTHTANTRTLVTTDYTFDGFKAVKNVKQTETP